MPFILFLLWIIFNGRITGDVLISGVLVAFFISVFCCRYLGYRMKIGRPVFKRCFMLFRYLPLLIWEMVKANFQVIGVVLSPKIKIRPCIIHFQPQIKSTLGRVLLANSITVVPGSVTCEMTDKGYSVHALTPQIARAQQYSAFEKLILKMESGD